MIGRRIPTAGSYRSRDRKSADSRHQTPVYTLACAATFLILTACKPLSHEERMRRMAPVFGQRDVTFIAGTDSTSMPIGQVVSVSETLGVHRRLRTSEAETIRILAQKQYDNFVVAEMHAIGSDFEAKKRAVRRKAAAEVASARRAQPAPSAAASEEKLRAKERSDLAEIDTQWRRSALIRVEEKYGSDLAIPIRSRDNKPVVAIANVKDGKVDAPDKTFELKTQIDPKTGKIIHRGREAAVLDTEVELPDSP